MKIQNIGINAVLTVESTNTKPKLDFSDSFNQANRSKTKEELDLYIKEIKNVGERLTVTQNYTDVITYKKLIKDYLKSVVDYTYDLNKNTSFWETDHFTTVNTINEKLEDLTKALIYDQKENIDVASTIDNIQGLLIDIYK
ncbi:DUF327 family protein [Romboutsia maritimum]|uniref:DUF327 family protein n=1 Tax=Romboutsia maritimum TaxID=2020948 RepID=A0A371IVJ7_9FIRM|nr:YaaR family protein [Romboutsia maritimum]RDY24496.1 DUF327 family protein [Romboutsia maritimum]